MDLLAGRPGGWSLTQIASALGLAKSSTLTIMISLEAAGLVSRTDNSYELDVGVLTPATGFLRGVDVIAHFKRAVAASPLLNHQIAHIAILAGTDVTYIARHTGRPPLPVTASVGDRFPSSITATGACLLAELDDEAVTELYQDPAAFAQWTDLSTRDLPTLLAKLARTRAQGYARDEGETHPNVLGLAMVVHRVGNFAQDFAVGASLQRGIVTPDEVEQAIAELQAVRQLLQTGNELR